MSSTCRLNQYRNYQYLMNLVPGATPPVFQNAQTDTPGRALSHNINGTNRNNNVTRIDGAASINVWLPHHAGYIAPVETIENVNISTNSFDAAQGMTGGAATAVQTKSGTNTFKGSAFYFRQQDEFNARRGYFDPSKVDASTAIMGGTVGGPIRRNTSLLLRILGAERRAPGHLQHLHRADRADAQRRLRRGARAQLRASASTIPPPARPTARNRTFFENAVIPANRISEIAKKIQAMYPAPNNPGTNNGLQNNLFLPRNPKADRDNYDVKVNWNRTSAHQIWAKFSMMQASVFDLFYLPFDGGRRRRHEDHRLHGRPDLDAEPDAPPRRQRRRERHAAEHARALTTAPTSAPRCSGIPGLNADGVDGPGLGRSATLQRHAGVQHRPVVAGQRLARGRRCGATSAATRSRPT